MKKMILEIPIPEYNWIDVPTLYRTCIGEFEDLNHVKMIGDLIGYLQRHEDHQSIIEMEYQMRETLCRSLVRDRLRFIEEINIHWVAQQLSHFLADFQKRTGLNFKEYKYEYQVLSNGKKIQFKTFTMLFNNEDDAHRHIAKIFTSGKDFPFKLVESN